MIEMVKLKIKTATKQKFVKGYLAMIKEGEELMTKQVAGIDTYFEQEVVDLRVKAPFFNYVVSQRNHRGELMSVSFKAMKNLQ
jgi:hypothetical protein